MMDGEPESMTVIGAAGRDCIACRFTVERLMDSMHSGSFPLCRAHLLRATSYGREMLGERPLAALPARGT